MTRRDGVPLIVVHGGESSRGYRNVLEALETGLAIGADMFEFDVRRTADGGLVVHHDEAIGGVRVCDLELLEARRSAAALGYALPALDHVLERVGLALRLVVELKEPGCERAVLDVLRSRGYGPDAFVITSFEPAALQAVRAIDETVGTGLLVYDMSGPEALRAFAASGAAFLGPDQAMVDDDLLAGAARAGIPLVPWTVNEPAVMSRFLRARPVAGLITDRPEQALGIRQQIAGGR